MKTLCMRVSYYKLQKANERDGGQRLLAGGVFFFPTVRRKNRKGRKEKGEAVATTPKRIFLSEHRS